MIERTKGKFFRPTFSVQSHPQIIMVADSPTDGIDHPNWGGQRGVFIEYGLLSRVDGSARFGFGTLLKEYSSICFLIVSPMLYRRRARPGVCIGTDGS